MFTKVDTVEFDSAAGQWTIVVTRHLYPELQSLTYYSPDPDDFPQDMKNALVMWATVPEEETSEKPSSS